MNYEKEIIIDEHFLDKEWIKVKRLFRQIQRQREVKNVLK